MINEKMPAPPFAITFALILCAKTIFQAGLPKAYQTDCSTPASRRRSCLRRLSVFADVGGEEEATGRGQPARKQVNGFALDEPAAMMFLLEPGIGIVDVKFAYRLRREKVRQCRLAARVDRARVIQSGAP